MLGGGRGPGGWKNRIMCHVKGVDGGAWHGHVCVSCCCFSSSHLSLPWPWCLPAVDLPVCFSVVPPCLMPNTFPAGILLPCPPTAPLTSAARYIILFLCMHGPILLLSTLHVLLPPASYYICILANISLLYCFSPKHSIPQLLHRKERRLGLSAAANLLACFLFFCPCAACLPPSYIYLPICICASQVPYVWAW